MEIDYFVKWKILLHHINILSVFNYWACFAKILLNSGIWKSKQSDQMIFQNWDNQSYSDIYNSLRILLIGYMLFPTVLKEKVAEPSKAFTPLIFFYVYSIVVFQVDSTEYNMA